MARIVALTNPGSRQNRKGFDRVGAKLAMLPGCEHLVTPDEAATKQFAQRWQDDPAELLVINGGDGTVHHLLSALLAAGGAHATLPGKIALLPGGTTNMTSHDISGRRSRDSALDELCRQLNDGALRTVPRYALKLMRGDDTPDQIGFFFGCGAIVSGIQYCHERVYRMGIADEIAPGFALARAAWGIASGDEVFSSSTALRIEADGTLWCEAAARVLLVTPLQRLFLGLTPFWSQGNSTLAAPLLATLVEADAQQFVRSLPAILKGAPKRKHQHRLTPQRGYHSTRGWSYTLQLDGPYTLDGELYEAPAGSLRIEAVGPFQFLSL